jgi:TPR repeat protein
VHDEADMALNFDDLRAKAEAGSTVARSVLGIALLHGYECAPDHVEAFRLLSLAAERRAPRAMVNLGLMYEQGLGITVDIQRARQLYQAGAEAGEFFGCIFLGRLLANGHAGESSRAEALKWYRRAAEQNVESRPESDEAKAYVHEHGGDAE